MSEQAQQEAPQAAPPPTTAGDDSEAFLGVSIVAGFLGVVLLMTALFMYLVVSWSEPGATLPEWIQKWNWVLAGGVGLVVLALGLQAPRLWDALYRNRSVFAVNAILMSALAVGLAGLIDYVTYRHFHEFDWTRQSVYTISDESIQVAKSIDKTIRIWIIFPEQGRAELVQKLVDHYRAKNPRIEVQVLDPVLDREKLVAMVRELGLEPRSIEDLLGAIVQAGYWDTNAAGVRTWHTDRSKRLTENDFFESSFDPQGGGRGAAKFKGEQALTNALIDVTEEKKPKLYFLQGHGELDLEGRRQGDYGQMGELAKELRGKNYDVQALNILDRQQKDVPEDANVLVIAGPTKNFDAQEVGALEAWLKNGGRLVVLLSAQQEWKPLGIEPLLRKYNVEVENKSVMGLQRQFDPNSGQAQLVLAEGCVCDQMDATSKVTQPVVGMRAAFGEPRPVKALSDNPHAKATEIVKTNAKAPFYAITNRENPEDELKAERKSIPIMVAVEQKLDAKPGDKEKVTRLVVAGDAMFASNLYLDQGVNEPLVLNSISWLLGQERFTKDAVKEGDYHLEMPPEIALLFQALACAGVPFLTIIVGMTVWIVRRR